MRDPREAPIGVFDSGVGGLTVILELLRQMPHESFIYYADTAHVPYGPRDPQELRRFASSISEFLVDKGCKLVIIACNTSTSLAYEELAARFLPPFIGVIEPGVDKALEMTKNLKIGVIATIATINSGAYQHMLRRKNPAIEVSAASCPLFVPLVEKGQIEGDEVYETAVAYLEPLKNKGIDSLVLGCTHYPFLLPVIIKALGPSIAVIDPARETVSRAKEKLKGLSLLKETGKPSYQYYASGDPESFRRIGSIFLGEDIGEVRGVKLD